MKEKDQALRKEIQLVVFRLQNEEFGVEIKCVREILRLVEITHIPEAPGFLEGVINLRGHVIAVVSLAKQFGLPVAELHKSARIVVVEADKTIVGMIVDEVPQVLSIAEESIEETPALFHTKVNADYIRGIAKLGERLIVMLDLPKVLAVHELEAVIEIEKGDKNG